MRGGQPLERHALTVQRTTNAMEFLLATQYALAQTARWLAGHLPALAPQSETSTAGSR